MRCAHCALELGASKGAFASCRCSFPGYCFLPLVVPMSSKRKVPLPDSPEKVAKYPVEIDLPPSVYKGIGKIISIHALLENVVSDLVFLLMKVNAAEGRTAFAYRSAGEQFKLVRKLLDLRGISVQEFNLNAITDQIDDCCMMRDQLAHGIWVKKDGVLGLRVTKGTIRTPGRSARARRRGNQHGRGRWILVERG
jgi:hypothetical protein